MMIPFFSKRKAQLLSLDVGSSGTKIVLRLSNDNSANQQFQVWHYPHPLHLNQPKERQAFLQFLKKNKLQGYPVAVAIEDPSIRIRRVDLPKMPDGDLGEAVRWQMRDVVDGPLQDNTVRHAVIEEYANGEAKRLAIVAYSIKKAVVTQWIDFLKSMGLTAQVIEPATVSILSVFDATYSWKPEDYYGLVHLGENHATFIVVHGRKLYFSRTMVGISGSNFLEMLEKEGGLSHQEALQFREKLILGTSEGHEDIVSAYRTKVAVEIQRSIDGFSLLFKVDHIQQVVLTGGGSVLPGLSSTLSETLGIPTTLLEVLPKFTLKGIPTQGEKIFDIALGLSLYSL